MTKQEQIDEIEDIISGSWNTKSAAQNLYNAGYRKVLLETEDGKMVDCVQYAPWELIKGYTEREVNKARKETAKKIISAMKTMIINRRADERSGLNSIYTTYSPERLFDDILDYVRIAMGVEVEE